MKYNALLFYPEWAMFQLSLKVPALREILCGIAQKPGEAPPLNLPRGSAGLESTVNASLKGQA